MSEGIYCSRLKRYVLWTEIYSDNCICTECDNVNCKRSNCMFCTDECLFSAYKTKFD